MTSQWDKVDRYWVVNVQPAHGDCTRVIVKASSFGEALLYVKQLYLNASGIW